MSTITLTNNEIEVLEVALMQYRMQTAEALKANGQKTSPMLEFITKIELSILAKIEENEV